MAMIYHPDADISKGEPVIEFTSPPELTDEKPMRLGMYASDHLEYLQKYHEAEFTKILFFGNLTKYLHNIQVQAEQREEVLTEQMVKSWGVTEELKRTDQLTWVGLMNNINQCVKEIIYDEIIYGEIAYGEIVYNGEVYTL